MNPDRAWLSTAIYRFYCLTTGFLAADARSEDQAAEINMAWQDIVVSAAHVLWIERDHNRSCNEVDDAALFDELLRAEGHSDEECAQARNVRQGVMLMANNLLTSSLRRGDDPASCDPGGGMRGPDDEIDDDTN